jgi:hypothetical protein
MVYNTQNYWVFGFFPSSSIVETRKQRFGNWIFFCPQVREGKKPTQLGPLERANLNHWTTPVRFTQLFNHLRPGSAVIPKVSLTQSFIAMVVFV